MAKRGRPSRKGASGGAPEWLAEYLERNAGLGLHLHIGRATPLQWKTSSREWKEKYGQGAKRWELKALEVVRPGGSADDIERWRQLIADCLTRMKIIEESWKPTTLPRPSEFRAKLKCAADALREVLSDRSGWWRVAHSDNHLDGPGDIPPSTIGTLELACEQLDAWWSMMEGAHLPHNGGFNEKDLSISEAAAEFAYDLIAEHICMPVQANKETIKNEKNPYYALAQLLAQSVSPEINTNAACRKYLQKILGHYRTK